MKTFVVVLAFSILLCCCSENTVNPQDRGVTTSEELSVPYIDSIRLTQIENSGDNALIVNGINFFEDTVVFLDEQLIDVQVINENQLYILLSKYLEEKEYELKIETNKGSVSRNVFIILLSQVDKGEKGDSGINGQDGKNGNNGIDGQDGSDGGDGQDGNDGVNLAAIWQGVWDQTITSIAYLKANYVSNHCSTVNRGVGFVVATDVVVTIANKVEQSFNSLCPFYGNETFNLDSIELYFPDSGSGEAQLSVTPAYVTAVDRNLEVSRNITFLQTSLAGKISLLLADNSDLKILDNILFVGFSMGSNIAYAFPSNVNSLIEAGNDLLTGLPEVSSDTEIILSDYFADDYSAGAPILNSDGEVVGVHFKNYDEDGTPDFSLAINSEYIVDALAAGLNWTDI